MSGLKRLSLILILSFCVLISGCATVSTLGQPAYERKPLVMSGSRPDVAALRNAATAEFKFGVTAPRFPLLDLPFSAFLDIIVLGYTIPVSIYYTL